MSDNRLSAEESELYDRQIRTWGLDTQFRIRNSHVCVVGMNGLGAEVCKNLVLAGVGALTMCDDSMTTISDLASQFFLTAADVGHNRAAASLERVQELNPRVKVYDDAWQHTDIYADKFDVVCFAHVSPSFMNQAIDCVKKSFIFIAQQHGLFGMYFIDLRGKFQYSKKATAAGDTVSSCTTEYISWKEAMSVPWSGVPQKFGRRRRQLVAEAYLCFRVLWDAWESVGRPLTMADMPMVLELRGTLQTKHELDEKWLPIDTLRQMLASFDYQLAPVCSIVGGSLSQQIITAISHKDDPYRNVAVYDAAASRSGVAHISN